MSCDLRIHWVAYGVSCCRHFSGFSSISTFGVYIHNLDMSHGTLFFLCCWWCFPTQYVDDFVGQHVDAEWDFVTLFNLRACVTPFFFKSIFIFFLFFIYLFFPSQTDSTQSLFAFLSLILLWLCITFLIKFTEFTEFTETSCKHFKIQGNNVFYIYNAKLFT